MISGIFALTSEKSPFELAVVTFDCYDDYQLCYDTPIAHDVLGYLTEDRVLDLLTLIQRLPDRIDFYGNLVLKPTILENVQLDFDF